MEPGQRVYEGESRVLVLAISLLSREAGLLQGVEDGPPECLRGDRSFREVVVGACPYRLLGDLFVTLAGEHYYRRYFVRSRSHGAEGLQAVFAGQGVVKEHHIEPLSV